MLESITVLCQEVEHIPVDLTCGRQKGKGERNPVRGRSDSKAFSKSSFKVPVLRMPKFQELRILNSYS